MEQNISQLLSQFNDRSVRDLAWVIASPPLVSGNIDDVHWWTHQDCLKEFNDCLDRLITLDTDPQPLITHLAELKNRRLGSIFEGLISFWLKISPNYRELYQNIQIIEDKHTFGEVDFIIQNIRSNKVIHLEVAVKFYLGCEPYEDAYRWFGTNTKDQLAKKIDHLRLHQTQLSSHYPQQLNKYCSETIDEKHCFVKGRLFYPEHLNISPQNLPLTDNHLRGRWTYVKNRKAFSHSTNRININKSHWLADLNSKDINDLEVSNEKIIETIDRAECFVEFEEIENQWVEQQRTFYLPNSFMFPEK